MQFVIVTEEVEAKEWEKKETSNTSKVSAKENRISQSHCR